MMREKLSRRSLLIQVGMAGLIAATGAPPVEARKKTVVLPAQFEKLDHERYMRLAIEQAKKVPNCPFGAVIVNATTGKVVSDGWVRMDKTPVWHGEMTAILGCPDSNDEFKWQDMCLYTTGESCPMCQSAIVWTKMPLAVYGSSIPFLQTCGFGQIDIRAQRIVDAAIFDYGDCTIIGGVLEKECDVLFQTAKKLNDPI